MVCLVPVQFLPQDKVVMFARLSPIELLRETEKAIGSGHLWELHQSLADKANSLRDDKEATAFPS